MSETHHQKWFKERHAEVIGDAKQRDQRRMRQQLTQIFASLHITVIVGMLVAGIIIIIGLLTNPTASVRLDMYNYTNYAKIYIVIFVVSILSFLGYTFTQQKEPASKNNE